MGRGWGTVEWGKIEQSKAATGAGGTGQPWVVVGESGPGRVGINEGCRILAPFFDPIPQC